MKIRILGTILWALGRLIKRIDVLHLGWYMMGTGRRRSIPKWAWLHTLRVDDNGHGWFQPYSEHRTPRCRMLFNSIGKFKAKERRLLDRYAFYPPCSSSRTHGQNCDCAPEFKGWQNVTLYQYRWSDIRLKRVSTWLRDHFQNNYKSRKIFGVSCVLNYTSFEVSASDMLFADLGTPFYITGQIPEHVDVVT